jgi:two-component system, NtrC family, sensor kinase
MKRQSKAPNTQTRKSARQIASKARSTKEHSPTITALKGEIDRLTRELGEAIEQQTATAEVLESINRSSFDLSAIVQMMVSTATRLCNAGPAGIFLLEGDIYEYWTGLNVSDVWREHERQAAIRAGRGTLVGRTAIEKRVVQILDALEDREYEDKEAARVENLHSMLGVPLMRDEEVIGVFALARNHVEPFAESQIRLVSTFADQAVIAIESARLFNEVQARTKELSESLDGLHKAQDRLVQTEKLASLGQLTAGIAHEIKNPLNFVNNFSALSVELIDELNELIEQAALTGNLREGVGEVTTLLKDNLSKVVQHGNRADSIVKNMLLHARQGSGEHRPADINALVSESLNLAYHGARAEKAGFNITLKQEYDPDAGELDLYPQEMTRALLNLISNGFYAATSRKDVAGDETFEPVLSATTRNLGKTVEIRIRDNGQGIPPEVREKMFNPFFTTKPTGEGTGLGLSMTHDIIVKQHGGRIDIETELGSFTEFIITLPRDSGTPAR